MVQVMQKRPDRRIERTRTLLRDALLALITERGYTSITVQDITDRANVSRTTFYLHYHDKDELLHSSLGEMYARLMGDMPRLSREMVERQPQAVIEAMRAPSDFEHAAAYADFYHVMFSGQGSSVFVTYVLNTLTALMQARLVEPLAGAAPRVPLPLIAAFLAGAQLNVVQWWLDGHQADYSAQQMADFLFLLSTRGAAWALELEGSFVDDKDE